MEQAVAATPHRAPNLSSLAVVITVSKGQGHRYCGDGHGMTACIWSIFEIPVWTGIIKGVGETIEVLGARLLGLSEPSVWETRSK